MFEFINGFETPKYKRYDEVFAGNGELEGGGVNNNPALTPSNTPIIDEVTIPYKRFGYYCGIWDVMNTGFGRIRMERDIATAPVSKCVGSFYVKFNGSAEIKDSGFYVLRNGNNPGVRVMELACRKSATDNYQGGFELWTSNNSLQQHNFEGTMVDSTATDIIQFDTWMHVEVVFDSGLVSVFVDSVKVMEATVLGTSITRHGHLWESFGFNHLNVDDYVFQVGADSERLGVKHRVTTLWPSSDALNNWYASGSPHYTQLVDRTGVNPYTYVALASTGYELFGWETAYPVGSILALQVSLFASPKSSSLSSSVQDLFRLGPAGSLDSVSEIHIPPYLSRETTETQRQIFANAIHVVDPSGAAWKEEDWIGQWYAGLTSGSGPAQVSQLVIERLHILTGGAGARYISY